MLVRTIYGQEKTTCTLTMDYVELILTLTTDMVNILDTTRRMILQTCITGHLFAVTATTAMVIEREQTFRELSSSQAIAESHPIQGIPRMKYAEDTILPTRRQLVTTQPTTHPTGSYIIFPHSDNTSPCHRSWLQHQQLVPPLTTPQINNK